jgi:HAE1 family hydrophobic/amphiphilic exporter-1
LKFGFVLLMLAEAGLAIAQTPAAQPPAQPALPPVKPMEVPARIGILGTAKISLAEVIQRVLSSDRDLAVSRINREEAGLNLRGALGVFDPRVGLAAHATRTITPVSSSLGGASNGKLTTKELSADPQLSGASPWLGTTYKLDFSSSRQLSNSSFNTLNPQFPTALNLNLTQPLWRGLRYDDNRHRIQVARKNVQLSDEQLRQRVIEIATQAVQAYWELGFAFRNLEVQSEAVRLAEQQDASNRRQVEQGLLAPVDVVQTQTQIATFQQNLFSAQTALTSAENALKALMLADRTDLMWGMALEPEQRPDTRIELPALPDAVKVALAGRPELKQSELSLEVNQLDVRLTREQTKAQVDVYAALSTVGLAGYPLVQTGANPFTAAFGPLVNQINALSAQSGIPPLPPISFGSSTIPPFFVGGYGQSLSNLGSGAFNSATVGVNISIPIRNRSANAAAAISVAEGRRLRTIRQQVEMAIEQDVRNSLQLVASAQARLDAANNAQQYAGEQYRSEQRQFQAGTTTVFLVLQRQTELIASRTRQVRAEADLGEAKASLDRALSRTIEVQSIQMK